MKTIYMSESADAVPKVYANYDFGRVCTRADLYASPESFLDTEYIFSTWGMSELTVEEIRKFLPNLKAIFYAAGTVQRFARPFLECGVRIFSAWMANAVPVAEYASSQILLASKGFFHTCGMKADNYRKLREISEFFPGNYDTTVGIIGAGAIGKMVIQRLKESKLNILVFDPFLPQETADALGVTLTDLDTLFRCSQVVSNHLANNPQTQGMLTGQHFSQIPPYGVFLNTGRGAQVVEEDLIATLQARPDLIAILDVTYPEPPEESSPLYTLPNCILTPHIAGSSGNEFYRMADYMHETFQAYLADLPLRYEVTLEMLKTMA